MNKKLSIVVFLICLTSSYAYGDRLYYYGMGKAKMSPIYPVEYIYCTIT